MQFPVDTGPIGPLGLLCGKAGRVVKIKGIIVKEGILVDFIHGI